MTHRLLFLAGLLLLGACTLQTPSTSNDDSVACTMDAKICPDGSYVGRVAPDCAFAPCPGETLTAPLP